MEPIHSKTCITCLAQLVGLQTKYCSRKCHNKNGNAKLQNYAAQQARGKSRKLALIAIKGGACELCGYKKNIAALCFHHSDPALKEMGLDARKLSNSSMKSILEELEKCQLLCHNCHLEVHHPDFTLE